MNADPKGNIVLYRTEDGKDRIECQLADDTIWLSQAQMGELFLRSKKTISVHLKNIFSEGELARDPVVRNFRTTANDGKSYDVIYYKLEAILAVGFRVKSTRGTQFRRWANTNLKELLVKGFAMDDERLKNPGGWDYFDELLARVREIRASEMRFYQKVRDLFALSADYDKTDRDAQMFFAEVQNKLLYAVAGKTAAEIVVSRADAQAPNMALTSWSGSRVRKQDVVVAKNYLTEDEIDTLNRLVVVFLEQAELRVKNRRQLTLAFWRDNIDKMLEFNEQQVLDHAGAVSAEEMKSTAQNRFKQFDNSRHVAEALAADDDDIRELEALEKESKKLGENK